MAIAKRIVEAHGGQIALGDAASARGRLPHHLTARDTMTRSLKIAVADDELDMRDYFQQILPLLGHQVVAVARDGQRAGRPLRGHPPRPGHHRHQDARHGRHRRRRADLPQRGRSRSSSSRPTTTPSSSAAPRPTTSWPTWSSRSSRPTSSRRSRIAMRRFEQFQALRKETADLKQALEDRKVIEKAKGILMKKAGLDEHDAFRRLQKLASDKNRKLIEIAQMILTAEEALQKPSRGS